jgi:hypothetical protein
MSFRKKIMENDLEEKLPALDFDAMP